MRALCESATVLRGGRVSGDCVPAECSDLDLARLMVGDAEGLEAEYPKAEGGTPFLRVEGLSWHNADPFGVSLEEIALDVRAGEIVGIAGVAGNGQDELLALLSGEQRLARDQARASASSRPRWHTCVRMRGVARAWPSSPPSGSATARCRT